MVTDLLKARPFPRDPSLLRAEIMARHRVLERRFMLSFIPAGSVGAELGVFTGLFSAQLSDLSKVLQITFVDPWWTMYGEHYPDWGTYTDHGRLKTRSAYDIAKRRIYRSRQPGRSIEVASSYDWLAAQPDGTLDWVYLDSTHMYEGTKRELALLNRKIKPEGLILGDDWHPKQQHPHHGVFLAVNEFVKASDFEFVLCGRAVQWVLRRRL